MTDLDKTIAECERLADVMRRDCKYRHTQDKDLPPGWERHYCASMKTADLLDALPALLPYVQHRPDCGAHPDNDHPSGNLPCTCGRDEALAALPEIDEPGKPVSVYTPLGGDFGGQE